MSKKLITNLGILLVVFFNIQLALAHEKNYPMIPIGFFMENRVSKLERISSEHSKLLIEIQQELSSDQRDFDHLLGKVQEIQYQLLQIIEKQKKLYKKIDNLSSKCNTVIDNVIE